jgi:hypothetical protein
MSGASPRTTVASGQSSGSANVDDTTVAGRLVIASTHGSNTSAPAGLELRIATNSRNVVAPNTIRCSPPYRPSRRSSSSGPCLPQ